ncbi:MAG: lactate dehydrogenase-like 2-hydroxyacid dehydrogenase [Paracoccaceae bacterium]|jgi:lactate dehydrogenase-like 2-hydroxyacid dehydrogenase
MDDLVVVGPMIPSVMRSVAENFRVHRFWEADDKPAFLQKTQDTRFLATDGHRGCSAATMDALPNLEIIACYGVGTDAIDLDAAKQRGIRVTNTPGVLSDAVAELAMGLMLTLCRRINDADRFIRDGKWLNGGYPLTGELTGATIGILGLGRIGKEIARRAQGFKMQVVYHGRTKQPFEPYPFYENLEEMARDVDWLVSVVPGGESTTGLVNRQVLQALGPKGAVVNLGRGSLIDEGAMIELLQSGELGGAALDVFEKEPAMSEALWSMPNVVLSPHQASATEKTRWAMGDLVVRNLRAHQAGAPAITPVV